MASMSITPICCTHQKHTLLILSHLMNDGEKWLKARFCAAHWPSQHQKDTRRQRKLHWFREYRVNPKVTSPEFSVYPGVSAFLSSLIVHATRRWPTHSWSQENTQCRLFARILSVQGTKKPVRCIASSEVEEQRAVRKSLPWFDSRGWKITH